MSWYASGVINRSARFAKGHQHCQNTPPAQRVDIFIKWIKSMFVCHGYVSCQRTNAPSAAIAIRLRERHRFVPVRYSLRQPMPEWALTARAAAPISSRQRQPPCHPGLRHVSLMQQPGQCTRQQYVKLTTRQHDHQVLPRRRMSSSNRRRPG